MLNLWIGRTCGRPSSLVKLSSLLSPDTEDLVSEEKNSDISSCPSLLMLLTYSLISMSFVLYIYIYQYVYMYVCMPMSRRNSSAFPLVATSTHQKSVSVRVSLPNHEKLLLQALSSSCEEGGGGLSKVSHHLSSSQTLLSANTYLLLLRASIKTKNPSYARQVHGHLLEFAHHDFDRDSNIDLDCVFLFDYLVVTLAKCGAIDDAYKIACSLDNLSVHSCTALISAYAECGYGSKSLEMYEYMKENGVEPNTYTFVALFKACGAIQDLETGRFLHSDARRRCFTSNPFIINTLVSMYGKCGSVSEAEEAFCRLSHPNPMSWSVMLSVYAQQGRGENALLLYRQMQEEGIRPNEHALTSIVQACAILSEDEETVFVREQHLKQKSLEILKALHAHPHMRGWHLDVVLGTALLGMYGKCGAIVEAIHTFQALSHRDLITWNALISVLVEQGHGENALAIYRLMQKEGIAPNELTFVFALQACCLLTKKVKDCGKHEQTKSICLGIGKALHVDAKRKGYASDPGVGAGLISMYSLSGVVDEAEVVFVALSHRDTVLWNAMLSAYIEQGYGEKAIEMYREMKARDVADDDVAILATLQACGATGSLEICIHLHFQIVSAGYDSATPIVSALLIAYRSCGTMPDALSFFNGLSHTNIVFWNACIAGHAAEGNYIASLSMFENMKASSVEPDDLTFISALSACRHNGLVSVSLEYFESMMRDYGLIPSTKHYGILLDLLGRAGHLEEAMSMGQTLSLVQSSVTCRSLMGACYNWGNVELGRQMFKSTLHS